MAAANSEVKSGAMSKAKAAKTFGVPRTTLLDKLSGRVVETATSRGPQPILIPTGVEALTISRERERGEKAEGGTRKAEED